MLIDSSAWLEYCMGTKKGEMVRDIIESDDQLFTSPVVLAEICSKSVRTDGADKADERTDFIARRCIMVGIGEDIGKNAGRLHAELRTKRKDFGMIDAIILSSAIHKKARVVTCDSHFRDLDNVMML